VNSSASQKPDPIEPRGALPTNDPNASRRDGDSLASIIAEVRGAASGKGKLDLSERDAMLAVAQRAEMLIERIQAIIDWADFALSHRDEFDSHGARNLDGPVFDAARAALAKAEASHV
jgi:hypothetical protein